MIKSFAFQLKRLSALIAGFSAEASQEKHLLIQSLSRTALPFNERLAEYHEVLLFMAAHPSGFEELHLVEKELERIGKKLKTAPAKFKSRLTNSGLPFTSVETHFSHDMLTRLLTDKELKVSLLSMDAEETDWNQLLRCTLPAIERSNTTAGYYFEELLEALKVSPGQQFDFILDQFSSLNHLPLIKDDWFSNLNMQVRLHSNSIKFSRTHNNFRARPVYYHSDLLKKFNHLDLLNSPIVEGVDLSPEQRIAAIRVVKNSLVLTARETDPCTYMEESSFRLYELERGISVALYTMTADRQLPLESYVGYTLMKNGFPAAYGGAWIFGERAHFGINIFESFRGGESGFVLCQLLRTYRQVFGINYFEVEPYQYGLDNPEGISSGAFWFYYRFGFRPLNKELLQLSNTEYRKIKSKPGYRSSEKTLIRFTESNIGLDLGTAQKISVLEVSSKVSALIAKKYNGVRSKAMKEILESFRAITGLNFPNDKHEMACLTDLLLMAWVLKKTSLNELKTLPALALEKGSSPYLYQQSLKNWLNNPSGLQKV